MKTKIPVLQLDSFKKKVPDTRFYVNRLEKHLQENHALISHPHKHDFYLTVLFFKGTGKHEIDFQSYDVEAGSVFVLKPGQTHHWELSKDTEGYIFFHEELSANFDLLDFPFYSRIFSPPEIKLKRNQIQEFANKFETLYDEFHSDLAFKARRTTQLIDLIYIDLSRIYGTENKDFIPKPLPYLTRIYAFEKLIEKYFKTEKSPTQYADWLNISAKHLNRITRETLNKTATEMISERVILEAKRLLSHSNFSLTEIALELGFEEYSYFSRYFKKLVGETLSEFRKRFKKH